MKIIQRFPGPTYQLTRGCSQGEDAQFYFFSRREVFIKKKETFFHATCSLSCTVEEVCVTHAPVGIQSLSVGGARHAAYPSAALWVPTPVAVCWTLK